MAPKRIRDIVTYILENFDRKTKRASSYIFTGKWQEFNKGKELLSERDFQNYQSTYLKLYHEFKVLFEADKEFINDDTSSSSEIDEEWREFLNISKEKDIDHIIKENNLRKDETKKFIDNAFRDGVLKTTGTELDKIMPPVSRFGGGRATRKQDIIEVILAFFERYFGLI